MDIPFGLEADTVFLNDQIITVDKDDSLEKAVAIKDNKIPYIPQHVLIFPAQP